MKAGSVRVLYKLWISMVQDQLGTEGRDKQNRQFAIEILGRTLALNYIMMLIKLADLSQSDHSNWVMWHVKDTCPDMGEMGDWHRNEQLSLRSIKEMNTIAVYLITVWKSKWKKETNKIYEYLGMIIVFFIGVLEGNLQKNSWCYQITDYLIGSLVKFKLYF